MQHMAIHMVSFRWSDEKLAAVDAARGDVPRSVWVWRAVEQALGKVGPGVASGGGLPSAVDLPASAEQPEVYVFEGERQAVRAAVEGGASGVRVVMGSALPRQHSASCKCPVCS